MKLPALLSKADEVRRLAVLRDGLRTQLWPLPTIGVVIGLALGVALPRLDARLDAQIAGSAVDLVFGGGASAARTMLGAVAASLITVTSLTFSLTVVTLQLASGQFSPRLLRTFSRDRFVHVTLALFLGTFTYALAVLRSVRNSAPGKAEFVPQVSVTVAFVLGVVSVIGLVLFLAHLAQEIRVETMLRRVHREARETVRRVLTPLPPGPEAAVAPMRPSDASLLVASDSGFLVGLDAPAVLAAAVAADAIVVIDCAQGGALVVGVPFGACWPRAGEFTDERLARLRVDVTSATSIHFERISLEDIGYGLRQLTDVATRALSPGVNDPTTAVHALGHVSALLCEIARFDLDPRVLRDEGGGVRAVLHRPDFPAMLETALCQPRRYGASDPFVLGRLFTLLRELAWCSQQVGQRQAVGEQLARLSATAAAQSFDPTEEARLNELALQVGEALAGRWPSTGVGWYAGR